MNGRPEGPFTIEQLKEKGIKPGDFVKTAAMDDYKEAHEIAELRHLLGFRQQPLVPQYFGSFDQRLLASALDWFFVSGVCILAAFILTLFTADKATRLFIAFGLLAVIPAAKLIYHVIMESSAKQATYGKQILRIKVCDMQGNRIGFAHALGRNFAKLFSVFTFFVGYLMCFFNKQQ
ncbi:MAG: hypothetical protein NVSMB24_20900 [Mucilaginibacter sp.]